MTAYTEIKENSDLNEFVNVGCYQQGISAKAKTITNLPVNVAFVMFVFSSNGVDEKSRYQYRKQFVLPYNSSTIYVRLISTNDSWATQIIEDWESIEFIK